MIDGDGEEDTVEEKSRIEGVDIPWSSRQAIWGIDVGEEGGSLSLFGFWREAEEGREAALLVL
jgi:hypothetical protein